MNDLMTIGEGQVPAHLQQYANDAASSLVTSVTSLPSLSIRGKQFRIRKGDDETTYPIGQPIDVVILAVDPEMGVARSYYSKAYTGNVDDQPDCASSDGITPDGHSSAPQSRSCAECPHNVFGTAKDANGNPSKGKACSDHKNLVVVEATNVTDNDLLMLRVPATSLKSLSAYGRKLGEKNLPPQVVATQLSFTDAEHPQLEFNPARWLTEAEANGAMQRANSDAVKSSLPTSMKTQATVTEAPKLEAPAVAPAAPAVPKTLVMTDKAGGATKEAFEANGWSEQQLIDHGYARYE